MSILIIGIALGGVGLGTFAWFSDTETVPNNVITTGNVDLGVLTFDTNGTAGPLKTSDTLRPGVPETMGYVFIWNNGSVDLFFKAHLLPTAGDLNLGQMTFTTTTYKGDGSEISGFSLPDGAITGWGEEGKVQTFRWADISDAGTTLLNATENNHPMESGFYQYFKVDVTLDNDAGNQYAGKSRTLSMIFNAMQTDNPNWGM